MTPPTLSPTSSIFFLFFLITGAHSQPSEYPTAPGTSVTFKPSVAIIVAIFSLMFSITFLLLMYAKFCHNPRHNNNGNGNIFLLNGDHHRHPDRTSSGIDKTVIESLPFFRFSSLRGNRDGLECSVCLSRFSDTEILRLLPKCKHAFHSDCIDRWLGSHSTCPLCRHRVDPDDVAVFINSCSSSSSSRMLFREADITANDDDDDLELFLERDKDKDQELLLHKHRHRIRVSGAVFKGRWSDLNSSDVLVLIGSEMMSSSKRHSSGMESMGKKIKEEMGRKKRALERRRGNEIMTSSFSRAALLSEGSKCMSDITGVTRFRKSGGSEEEGEDDDDKVRRIWWPIAQRTVRWFAGEERRITTTTREAAIVLEV